MRWRKWAGGGRNRFDGVLEVVTFLGPVARLEVTVHGRPFLVDVAPAQARAYQRKKPLALTFDGPVDPETITTVISDRDTE